MGEHFALGLRDDIALGDGDDIGQFQHRADLFRRVDAREIIDHADRQRALDMRRAAVAQAGAFGDQDVDAELPPPIAGNRRCCETKK